MEVERRWTERQNPREGSNGRSTGKDRLPLAMRRGPLVAAAAALNLAVVSLSLLLVSISLDIRVSRAAAAASGNAADDADRQRADGVAEGPGGDYDPRGLQTWTDGESETLSRREFPFAFRRTALNLLPFL